jgi:hypothetical protein
MLLSIRRPFVASLLVPLLATCGGTEPSAPEPVAFVLEASPPATVKDHELFAVQPIAQLVDADGAPVEQGGVTINLGLTAGGAILQGGPTTRVTGADGRAIWGGLRLSGTAAIRTLRFQSAGMPNVDRVIVLAPGAAASIRAGTTPSTGYAGTLVPAFEVWVEDSSGNRIPGATIDAAASAGGAVSPTIVTSGTGTASVSNWKLKNGVGPNFLTLSTVGATGVVTVQLQVDGVTGPAAQITLDTTWTGPLMIDSVLAAPIVVTAKDTVGNPVKFTRAVFVHAGPSTNSNVVVLPGGDLFTDSLGHVTLPAMTVPLKAGRYSVGVTIGTGAAARHRGGGYTVIPGSAVQLAGSFTVARGPVGIPQLGVVWTFDKGGNPVTGPVDATVIEGGGSVTVDSGLAPGQSYRLVRWTFGSTGRQELHLSLTSDPAQEATLVSSAVAPTDIVTIAGDGQTGQIGTSLPVQPVFRVIDAGGAGVASVPIQIFGLPHNSYSSDSAGYLHLTGATFFGPPGARTMKVSTPWIPGDTATIGLIAVAGPVHAIANLSTGATYFDVATPSDSGPLFRVQDALEYGIAGVTVHFTASSGGFAVDSAVSDSLGRVRAPTWIPGTVAGTASVTASVDTITRTSEPLLIRPGSPATLELAPGPGAVGFAGELVSAPIRLFKRDQYGNKITDVALTMNVLSGGGVAVSSTAGPDSSILAWWTLGPVPGINEIGLSSGTGTLNVSVNAPASTPFKIGLRGVPAAYVSYFGNALYQWRRRITADIPDISVNIAGGQCAPFQEGLSGVVDDLIIDVSIGTIDGPGGILGGATPCFIRTASKLPILGVMQFDVADAATLIADGTFGDVVLHEMGHVLGIGSLWSTNGILINPGTSSPQYTGAGGQQGWAEIGGLPLGTVNVPVENTGGAGTRDSHWREIIMPSELMTGYLSALVNPMSAVTVRSLTDLGYTIDAATADPYTVQTAPPVEPGGRGIRIRDQVGTPRFTVDENGKVTPIGH